MLANLDLADMRFQQGSCLWRLYSTVDALKENIEGSQKFYTFLGEVQEEDIASIIKNYLKRISPKDIWGLRK